MEQLNNLDFNGVEFDRFKKEAGLNSFNLTPKKWDVKRVLSKVNYQIQTDAVKNHIIPKSKKSLDKQWIEYAEEADLLKS
ncbi:hypothetical protein [Zunongwangia pacifica]|uniref:Uncharacterized protein n=1 Tax=Zunongwangia pacifica TaxID=2911062 RepID=A0A9X1ZUU1_9FLAO|nr:hypothetical protein [Zunongwangia pacifica]MCL6217955.1 hypothetical protein [Zunongwangia pacifica]